MFLRIVLVMGLCKIQHNLINTPASDIMARRQVVGGFGGKGRRETLMAKEKGVDCSLSFLRIFCLCSFLRVEQSSIECSSGSVKAVESPGYRPGPLHMDFAVCTRPDHCHRDPLQAGTDAFGLK